MENLSALATLVIGTGILAMVSLLALHFLSPEFKPAWRMISEYAMGKHNWLLTLFFISWGVCSMLSAMLLWNMVTTTWAIIGVILIFLSGVGALMGGLFDVRHKLHGLSFALGVPTLPIGSLLVSYNLVQHENWSAHQPLILSSAHATWISLLLMAFSMMLIFSGFKKSGIPVGPDKEPPTELPAGVIGVNGYVNRILVICYIAWPVLVATILMSH